MKKIKWLLIVLGVLAVIFVGYNYLYQDHRDIETESAKFTLTSKSLITEFKANSTLAETKFLNKTIEVTGTITEITEKDITLDHSIFNSFTTPFNRNDLKQNTSIKIKGRCIGYDDLLEQVKLDQCSIKN